MPIIFDNIHDKLGDDLKNTITSDSKLSVAAGCFSIYAFEALKKELENISELRFIFTSPTFTKENIKKQKREFYIPKFNRERNLYGSDFEIKLRNQLTQRAIAKECADWIRNKVHFKSIRSNENMDGFLNVRNNKEQYTYLPFNEFTTTELGYEHGNDVYQRVNRFPNPASNEYLRIFDELWNDSDRFKDVTDTVIENVETVYKENSPDFIYFITLYNIFNEFLEDISEDVLPNEATGFKSSEIWNKLYNFQKDAALAIINKLEKYNGCILADSVGLGKTFTALAVIKYYENRNKSVLVLCPKKLNDNWQTYKSNYVNNPIVKDRLRYDILFHTDLSRDRGISNGLQLDRVNWGNYDLVVIDESHNFRNGGKVTSGDDDDDPRENRYLRLMNKVMRSGVKTKVLMLSATPVNNRFNDLKNQLQLAYEGDSSKINDKLNTSSSIDDIFRQAQAAYNKWTKFTPKERTTARLLDMLSFDFFELLDSVTIARSRKHIEQYYDTTAIGKFPTRLKPISRFPHLTDLNKAINYKDIFDMIQTLNLAIYAPSEFIQPSKMSKYVDEGAENNSKGYRLSLEDREKGIRRLMGINMLKRLESSVNSFRQTIQRIDDLIKETIQRIDNFNGSETIYDYDIDDTDLEDIDDNLIVGKKKNKISLADMDYVSWEQYLKKDEENIELMITMLQDITPEHDSKLQQLILDLKNKFEHPINGNNRKVLIFTAFSDTALYLYQNLSSKIKEHYGLNTALITGDMKGGQTTIEKLKPDFNTILTLFSPVSKERGMLLPNVKEDIDVLIATDCISEGQNLQDCDYLINYDIHWNPVRIIQRFGRIDRIGSKNDVIQLMNYWPDMTLDEYINLKGRVEAKMKVAVLTATGDENLLSPEEKGDLEYRKQQLKRLQEEVVNIEDMDTGVNIMDLGLNEFRLDLLDYMKDNPDVAHTPFGMSAVVGHTDKVKPGVIYVLKNRNNGVNINNQNRLHPFYMVYLADDGSVICDHLSPKTLLDIMRATCKDKHEPVKDLYRQFNKETRDGKQMSHYSDLLRRAIESIIEVKDESDINAFLGGEQLSFVNDNVTGLDNFELICFLVIK
ncbi:MAG: DEAD/DEAH box helicase family protein [Bacteroidales bacterium]|jgi:SNF2 family DNA or RNA helicase|nr:DEAD/DEAH box helicase family protein [Bacteroidales bacterium]MCI2146072.1 DEAD/DEAH box helicase family protein [Bacteroidales bacterium]